MGRATAILVCAVLLSQCSSALAQESNESDPFLHPRVAKLESSLSSGSSEPVLVDLGVDASSPSTAAANDAPITFDDQTIPQDLDERQAEIQGKVFSDALRVLGYSALLICAAIVGLIFYGQYNSESLRRRHSWD